MADFLFTHTSTVLMVAPHDFAFNTQTSANNEFQHQSTLAAHEITQQALHEFDYMVAQLQHHGIDVLLMPQRQTGIPTPDAVFPNNWVSLEDDGTVVLYPMYAENRRAEKRLDDLSVLLQQHGLQIRKIIALDSMHNNQDAILEGTGSMVICRRTGQVYVAISERSHPYLAGVYTHLRHLNNPILFHTASSNHKPFYHTNVMMSLGEKFAVICLNAIVDDHMRAQVQQSIDNSGREIIALTHAQIEQHFCANILQIGTQANPIVVMSERALHGYTASQKKRLEAYATILSTPLETIEYVGGGSARCMIAEIFLPKQGGNILHATGI